jgi:signal transduction histidine kinase
MDTPPLEHRILRKDGAVRWVCDTTILLKDASGQLLSYDGVIKDITERKQADEEIMKSQEQLRALAARLQSIREEERTSIAREIHDELGQALTGLKMDLSWLENKLPKKENSLIKKTQSMLNLIDSTIQTVRRVSTELRPGILDDLGLIAALEWQAQEFQDRTGIKCEFNSSLEEVELDRDRSTGVFRIFQETLTNVARHSNATQVNIRAEESIRNLILRVKDNGRGITKGEISDKKSLGLLGMRERAHIFGGEVEITGGAGKGTSVTVKIPIGKSDQ